MKKRILAGLISLAMLLGMMTSVVFAAETQYSDTDGHWAEASIARWSEYGIVQGNNGLFNPDRPMTRAEAAVLVAKLLSLSVKADISSFADVDPDEWYADAIAMCVAAGIMNGTGTGMNPNGTLTREQMFVMLGRALGIQPEEAADKPAEDDAAISDWAAGTINAMRNKGYINGLPDGSIAPQLDIDRASVMKMLDQTIAGYANEPGTIEVTEDGVVLVVTDDVAIISDGDITVIVTAPDATVSLEGATGEVEVNVLADDVEITDAPAGTVVATAEEVTGTKANGDEVAKDSEIIVEEKPAPPEEEEYIYVHSHNYNSFVSCNGASHTMRCSCGATADIAIDPAHEAHIGATGYATLAEAVAAAQAGDTILLTSSISIAAGPENNIVIDKALTIDGNGNSITRSFNDVVIDGYGDYEAVFQVEADGVTIENVAFIQDSVAKKDEAFIYVSASDLTVQNNIFTGIENSGLAGVITASTTTPFSGIVIEDNVFTSLKYGGYFNNVSGANVNRNTIRSTQYNAFNIAAGTANFNANVFIDIATADPSDTYGPAYNSGICAQEGAIISYLCCLSIEEGRPMHEEDDPLVYLATLDLAAAVAAIDSPKSFIIAWGDDLSVSFDDDRSNGNYLMPYGGGESGTLQLTYDVAKFLEQLKLVGRAESIVYDGVNYSWNEEKGTASKWYNGETSLVSAIITKGVADLNTTEPTEIRGLREGVEYTEKFYGLEEYLIIDGYNVRFGISISEESYLAAFPPA